MALLSRNGGARFPRDNFASAFVEYCFPVLRRHELAFLGLGTSLGHALVLSLRSFLLALADLHLNFDVM